MSYDEATVLSGLLGYDLPSIDRALSRSLIDAGYRARLLVNARDALAEEGVMLPEGVGATCHEVDLNDRHFFLPPMVSDPEPDHTQTHKSRPGIAPRDLPVRGGVRPGIARPFMLGNNYPAPASAADLPDTRW